MICVEVRVEADALEDAIENGVERLATFLGERLGTDVRGSGGALVLELPDGQAGARRRLRQLLKKFLYREGLSEEFRVISDGGGGFIVKRRKPKP
ncbi:hypothetical protein DRO48_01785 [Candidatus Bathyarchaeota archaeon]|nr:MAG: hypothetical protein DRO48_01785 [Candidatus Bathyarchaeota archaeon]HDI42653.1 hypothetical protein [Candidatus Bathyarchaeota archaeon]